MQVVLEDSGRESSWQAEALSDDSTMLFFGNTTAEGTGEPPGPMVTAQSPATTVLSDG
jgi:hypothetical protein